MEELISKQQTKQAHKLRESIFEKLDENNDWSNWRFYMNNIFAGTIGFLLMFSFSQAYAAITFTGSLQIFLPFLINQILWSNFLHTWISTISCNIYFPVGGPNTTMILFLIGIRQITGASLINFFVASSLMTLLYGLVLYAIGRIKLENIFLCSSSPYPEYLHPSLAAGISLVNGFYFFMYGFSLILGKDMNTFSEFATMWFFPTDILYCLPAVIFAGLSYATKRYKYHKTSLIFLFFMPTLSFYLVIPIFNISSSQLEGWFFEPFPPLTTLDIYNSLDFTSIDLHLLLSCLPTIFLGIFVLTLELVFVLQSLQITIKKAFDYDENFLAAGAVNIVNGICGGIGGHITLLEALSVYQYGATSRFASYVTAFLHLLTLYFGFHSLIIYVPKFAIVVGIIELGITFFGTWLYDKWFEWESYEWLVSLFICLIGITHGLGTGVFVGTLISVIISCFTRRVSIIHNVQIQSEGDFHHILIQLKGFLFVRTCNSIFWIIHKFQKRYSTSEISITLDFSKVAGLDSSSEGALQALFDWIHKQKWKKDVIMPEFDIETSFEYEARPHWKDYEFMIERLKKICH